jgi:hypothetical protein
MRKAYFAMALSVLVTLVYGATQSKVETELRARLAAAESARVLALQDKAAMTATVARLTKAREQSAMASGRASRDAAVAQETAENTADIIAQAATAAAAAAVTAQSQASKFNANSMALIYVQGLILIGILAGFVNSALISGREHRWAVASAEKSRTTMDLIEKNTNHMVSVMQKSAFKEGFEAGHDQPN